MGFELAKNGPLGPLNGAALRPVPSTFLDSSSAHAAAKVEQALLHVQSDLDKTYAIRDAAVMLMVDVAGEEFGRSGRADTLRDRFFVYVQGLRMSADARLLAYHFAVVAKIGGSGLLEVRDYVFDDLAAALEITFGRVSVAHGTNPGGLQQLGLIRPIVSGGCKRRWHVALTIGAADADLPARKVEAFKAAVWQRSGLPGA